MQTSTPTQYGFLEDTFSIRGMDVQKYVDYERGTEIWKPIILHPFRTQDMRLRVSLNDKLLATAYEKGITGILVAGRVLPPAMYSPQALKKKVKAKEFEVKESYWGQDKNYLLYYFVI